VPREPGLAGRPGRRRLHPAQRRHTDDKDDTNAMQGYESMIILDPEASEEAQKELIEKFKSLVGSNGGQVVHHATWGRRKLAYEVKKREYGVYHLLYLDRTPEALRALENAFRIDDNVLKWMSVAVDDVGKEFQDFEKLKSEGSIAQTLTE
jgi:small subunit ribosomal protein S6